MARPVVLYRPYEFEYSDGELEAMRANFPTTPYRSDIVKDDLVIGRYSVLPFYREQAEDFSKAEAELINSYHQHRYIADLSKWYSDLEGLTPKTWFDLDFIDGAGPYVLKGETNSRRQKWSTHMYAEDADRARRVYARLKDDQLLANQTICIRKFEKLRSLGTQVNGMPIGLEYRFFICDQQILSGGFYWSSCVGDCSEIPPVSVVPQEFLEEVVAKIGDSARYYVIDVGQRADGQWIVIELNDAQMSGLSENRPEVLFSNLRLVLNGENSFWKQK